MAESPGQATVAARGVAAGPRSVLRENARLIWVLSLGAFGLAWSITTVAAYLPPILEEFTSSAVLVGIVLAARGDLRDRSAARSSGRSQTPRRTPFGRRRPYMAFAIAPMTLALVMVVFMPSLAATAFVLFAFFFAYYIYEPPYRGLYPDLLPGQRVRPRAGRAAHHAGHCARSGAGRRGRPARRVGAVSVRARRVRDGGRLCSAVIVLTRERAGRAASLRAHPVLLSPRRGASCGPERDVRRFLIANTAWEATFAGMRTFVVLYIIEGLGQPLYVSSAVLAVVAVGYVVAAAFSGPVGDRFGLARVILAASLVYGLGLTLSVLAQQLALVVLPARLSDRRCRRHRDDARLGPALQADAAA